jgi:hypothetical protein
MFRIRQVRAKSTHTPFSSILLDWLQRDDFRSTLKHHMECAIEHVRREYSRRAVPPLPVDEHEKKQEVHSDNEGGDSMDTANVSSRTASDAGSAGTSSQYSGQPPEFTHDTKVSVPQQK